MQTIITITVVGNMEAVFISLAHTTPSRILMQITIAKIAPQEKASYLAATITLSVALMQTITRTVSPLVAAAIASRTSTQATAAP